MQKLSAEILFASSTVNLKNKTFFAIEHTCERPQPKHCLKELAEAQKTLTQNKFNIELASS